MPCNLDIMNAIILNKFNMLNFFFYRVVIDLEININIDCLNIGNRQIVVE